MMRAREWVRREHPVSDTAPPVNETAPPANKALSADEAPPVNQAPPQPVPAGRIPFALRIGVTGHRTIKHPELLAPLVEDGIRQLRELVTAPGQPEAGLVVVSSLAEGADRFVTEIVLGVPGSRLEAALPLPPEEYCRDFTSAESRAEFGRLLGRASERWTPHGSKCRGETYDDGTSRDLAYEKAGHYVVDRSDALIALWDGEPARGPGGTGAIVAYARRRRVPLVWVKTGDAPSMVCEFETPTSEVLREAARELDEFNSGAIKPAPFERQVAAQQSRLKPAAAGEPSGGALAQSIKAATEWLVPYFVRADVLALRLQRRFRVLSSAMFVMAAAAVTVVAVQVNFFPSLNWLAILEVLLLLCLLAIPLLSRREHLHDRWISYRFLAERLRSAYFLALAGTGDRKDLSARLAYFSDSTEAWIERSLAEVIACRPQTLVGPGDLDSLRAYLIERWIGGQVNYHRRTAHHHRKWDTRLLYGTAILFGVTLVAAIAHIFGQADHGTQRSGLAVLVVVLSISIPAIGAALHGISAQRQFRHHARRGDRMVGLLSQLQQELDEARTLEDLRRVAAETEQIMREENSDWFGVMRFLDMELIT
jgi:hypothetical protein